MKRDPFDALNGADVGWHYSGPGVAPTPDAIASARIVHGMLLDWTTSIEVTPAVGGGVMMEAMVDQRDVFVLVYPDGVVALSGMPRGETVYTVPGDALRADLTAWLGPPGR